MTYTYRLKGAFVIATSTRVSTIIILVIAIDNNKGCLGAVQKRFQIS
jgi:hypothetical protein